MDDRDRAQLGFLIDHTNAAIGYARGQGRAARCDKVKSKSELTFPVPWR
jgi:hypothetical protein